MIDGSTPAQRKESEISAVWRAEAFVESTNQHDIRFFRVALLVMALLGMVVIFLFPGSPEQDSGYHLIHARLAWHEPAYFVGVWERPLYAVLFAGPALLGFTAARCFALCISLAIAWQTWKLARELQLERSWLVVPLLLAQPTFFELYTDVLTEPLFALVFVIALRLHFRGRTKTGMLIASLLPLARPEGAFLCLLWGCWVYAVPWLKSSRRSAAKWFTDALPLSLLGTGTIVWWAAAFAITSDPLFILHNWPPEWHANTYGHGTIFSYGLRSLEFIGAWLLVPFAIGLIRLVWPRKQLVLTTSWLLFFLLHSVFWAYGLFGEAGYARYMVSVAPVTALITLFGWNSLSDWCTRMIARPVRQFIGASVLGLSLLMSLGYLDGFTWSRDFVAIREMVSWFKQSERPVHCFVWSNAMMCLANPELPTNLQMTHSREQNLQILQAAPAQTLVFWDDDIGPKWFGLTTHDIEAAGFQVLRVRQYALPCVLPRGKIDGEQLTRRIELSLLYKPGDRVETRVSTE
jgi:hypothetical protein